MNCMHKTCPLRVTTEKYGWCQAEGKGNMKSSIMLVGEALGEEEAKQGLPFVGRAGKLLDNILFSIGLTTEDVYITNTVCCRPIRIEKDVDESEIIKNRAPTDEETEACKAHLYNKIGMMDPFLIIALGKTATDWFFPKVVTERGIVYRWKHFDKTYRLLPLFHPAALLYNPNNRKVMEQHLKANMELIIKAKGVLNV